MGGRLAIGLVFRANKRDGVDPLARGRAGAHEQLCDEAPPRRRVGRRSLMHQILESERPPARLTGGGVRPRGGWPTGPLARQVADESDDGEPVGPTRWVGIQSANFGGVAIPE